MYKRPIITQARAFSKWAQYVRIYRAFFVLCLLVFPAFLVGEGTQKIAIVQTSVLNVYEGAGRDYPIVGQLAQGDTVTIMGEQGEWLNIQFFVNVYGWISAQEVSIIHKSQPEYPMAPSLPSETEAPRSKGKPVFSLKNFFFGLNLGFGSANQTLTRRKSGSNSDFGLRLGYNFPFQGRLGLSLQSRSRLIIDPFTNGALTLRYDQTLARKHNLNVYVTSESYDNGTESRFNSSATLYGIKANGAPHKSLKYTAEWRRENRRFYDTDQNYISNQRRGDITLGSSKDRLIMVIKDYSMNYNNDERDFHRVLPSITFEHRTNENNSLKLNGELDFYSSPVETNKYLQVLGRAEGETPLLRAGGEAVMKHFPENPLSGYYDARVFSQIFEPLRLSLDALYRIQRSKLESDFLETKAKNTSALHFQKGIGIEYEAQTYTKFLTTRPGGNTELEHVVRGFLFVGIKNRWPSILVGPLFGISLTVSPGADEIIVKSKSTTEYGVRTRIHLPRFYGNQTSFSASYFITAPMAEEMNTMPTLSLSISSQQRIYKNIFIHFSLQKFDTKVELVDNQVNKFSYQIRVSYQYQ